MGSKQAIFGPQATPPRYGLLPALGTLDSPDRWQQGVKWGPEQCGDSGATTVDCGVTDEMTPGTNPDIAMADPIVVYASDHCSTFGFEARDFTARALRQLDATQSFQVAKELWAGAITVAESLDNIPLNDSSADTVTSAPVSIKFALGFLEQELAVCGQGRRGIIHMTPMALIHAVGQRLLEVSSAGVITTPLGTLVIADAGYDGSGPGNVAAGASQWMYATTWMQVRLSPVDVIPGTLADARTWAAAITRSTNDVLVFAMREALVQWDPCCHKAAELDIPITSGA